MFERSHAHLPSHAPERFSIRTPSRFSQKIGYNRNIPTDMPLFAPLPKIALGVDRLSSTERFHPQHDGASCALDTLNMLVNGTEGLRSTARDYIALKEGRFPESHGFIRKLKATIAGKRRLADLSPKGSLLTHPGDFSKLYARNFELGKAYFRKRLKRVGMDPIHRDQTLAQLHELEAYQRRYGALHHVMHFADPLPTNTAATAAARRRLAAFSGSVIGVAKAMRPTIARPDRGFTHHYFTLEKSADGTWQKRDAVNAGTTKIRHVDDMRNLGPATETVLDAVEAMQKYSAVYSRLLRSQPAGDIHKGLHLYIPGPPTTFAAQL